MNFKLVAVFSIGMSVITTPVLAGQGKHDSKDGGRPHGPPEIAFTVCADAQEGENCSFSARRGDVEGQCYIKRSEMVCVPERHQKNCCQHHDRQANVDSKGEE